MKPLHKKEIKKLNKSYRHNKKIYLILENIQYARNVASIFRIADALKVEEIILTGISQKPPFGKDLSKVSRYKEKSIHWRYFKTTEKALNYLREKRIPVIAIEQTDNHIPYFEYRYPQKYALLVGNEGYGITKKTLSMLDYSVFIPVYGKGASLNVHVSLAIVGFYSVVN